VAQIHPFTGVCSPRGKKFFLNLEIKPSPKKPLFISCALVQLMSSIILQCHNAIAQERHSANRPAIPPMLYSLQSNALNFPAEKNQQIEQIKKDI
jgi:hypothetical protein